MVSCISQSAAHQHTIKGGGTLRRAPKQSGPRAGPNERLAPFQLVLRMAHLCKRRVEGTATALIVSFTRSRRAVAASACFFIPRRL